MREPDTIGAWMEQDQELHDQDIRRRASLARMEDEYLDALREAGSLAAGAAVMQYGRRPRLSLTDRITLAEARLRRDEEQRAQAALPPYHGMDAAERERLQAREAQTAARLAAFRTLGDGPALSEEWRRAQGAGQHDYEAAVRAELAARSLKETA